MEKQHRYFYLKTLLRIGRSIMRDNEIDIAESEWSTNDSIPSDEICFSHIHQ